MSSGKTPVIAIDGPSASGKGALSRRLADLYNFAVLDTGLLYRATGFVVVNQDLDPSDTMIAARSARDLGGKIEEGILSNPALRDDRIARAASIVAAQPDVRAALLQLQRDFASSPPKSTKGAILDGRDIGTVVCPDADAKFFVTATPEIRAERRARDLYGDHWRDHFEAVLTNLHERDARDSQRTVAPTKAADDAFILDTSEIGIDVVVERAVGYLAGQGVSIPA